MYLSKNLDNVDADVAVTVQRKANRIARKEGCHRATDIIFGDHDRLVKHTPYGYRKRTTGEYVPNAYVSNFGWKNTYYQRDESVVELNVDALKKDSYVWRSLVVAKLMDSVSVNRGLVYQ